MTIPAPALPPEPVIGAREAETAPEGPARLTILPAASRRPGTQRIDNDSR